MGVSHAHSRSVDTQTADQLAAQFHASAQKDSTAARGVDSSAAQVFGWTTWPKTLLSEGGVVISLGEVPVLLLRFERDLFNSSCLQIHHTRMHWLMNPAVRWTPDREAELSKRIASLVRESGAKMVAVRLLGHNPPASQILQCAGFRLIIGNAWFYRWPDAPPPVWELPSDITTELRDLRRHPMAGADLREGLAIAQESVFPDRFSMDLRILPERAQARFMKAAENGLSGKVADYAALARINSELQALVLFGVRQAASPRGFPVAGERLMALARRELRVNGLSTALLAESICRLPEGRANWMVTAMLDNFRSLGGIAKLRFRHGAIAYDLHWWHDQA